MFLLFLFLFVALFFSFLCSIMEAVLLSTPRSYLYVKESNNLKWATQFLFYKDNVDRPLSAILSMNTIAHTVGAAGVGAQAVVVFGDAYFAVVSAILTILILVLTEIIPKTIGARHWRKLSGITVQLIKFTIFITYPLVILAELITKFISTKDTLRSISREEISALASVGADEGIFNEKEHKIIQNLLRLKNIKVSEVMTPRTVVKIANENMSIDEFIADSDNLHFSRIPLFSDTFDNITGYVLRRTVFDIKMGQTSISNIGEIKRAIVSVSNAKSLFGVWEYLLENKENIALVVDKYGGFDGIVTMEDIIETILGLELIDELDDVEDMQQYAKDRWEIKQKKYKFIDRNSE